MCPPPEDFQTPPPPHKKTIRPLGLVVIFDMTIKIVKTTTRSNGLINRIHLVEPQSARSGWENKNMVRIKVDEPVRSDLDPSVHFVLVSKHITTDLKEIWIDFPEFNIYLCAKVDFYKLK